MSASHSSQDAVCEGEGPARTADWWWDDFVMDDWVWVSQKVSEGELTRKVEGLLAVLRGDLVGQIRRDFLRCGEPFELGDPVIQETVWGSFFESLDPVWEFGESVRSYHKTRYPPDTEGRQGARGGRP